MTTTEFLAAIKKLGPIYSKARKDRDIEKEQYVREELAILLLKFGPTKSMLRSQYKRAEAEKRKCIKNNVFSMSEKKKELKYTDKMVEAKAEIDCEAEIDAELDAFEAYDASREAAENCVHIMNAIASAIKLTINSEVHA